VRADSADELSVRLKQLPAFFQREEFFPTVLISGAAK
jgi:hypothetical protein